MNSSFLLVFPTSFEIDVINFLHVPQSISCLQGGIGESIAKTIEDFLCKTNTKAVILLGYGGSLCKDVNYKDIVICSDILAEGKIKLSSSSYLMNKALDATKLTPLPVKIGASLTVERIITTPEEKSKLGKTTGASIVEMENYWACSIASKLSVPFLAVRIVLDTVEDSLPNLMPIMDLNGRLKLKSAFLYVISHPWDLKSLIRLSRLNYEARGILSEFLKVFISILTL